MNSYSERVALIKSTSQGICATGAFVPFTTNFTNDAAPGDLVTIDADGAIARRFGRPSSVHAVIEALLTHHGETGFTNEELREASEARDHTDPNQRRDLRQLPTFTIDGESTRDFDDAISAQIESDGVRVWVHVADVTAYIRPDSLLDRVAAQRATSLYMPTQTRPMLPESLSAGLCSLTPGHERLAVTVEMKLVDGVCVERQFYRSTIISDARLTYDHVDQIFLGRMEPGPTYAAALRAARDASGSASIEDAYASDWSFRIEAGEVHDVYQRPAGESHRLIERLMVMANCQVAEYLSNRGTPSLYRVHRGSDDERKATAHAKLAALGYESLSLDDIHHHPDPQVAQVAQGLYAPAEYAVEPSAHAGLDTAVYTHFTSPIRRYADILVHRALLAEIEADELATAPRLSALEEQVEHINERTKTAKRLSRTAHDICRVSYLRHQLRQSSSRERTGTVVGMSDRGLFIDIGELQGFLPVDGTVDEQRTVMTDGDGRQWSFGDTVEVTIKSIDPVRGRIKLAWLPTTNSQKSHRDAYGVIDSAHQRHSTQSTASVVAV